MNANISEQIEESMILYYADYLSLKNTFKPVTDNCKYYIIYNTPLNSAFICDLRPCYDTNGEYYKKAKEELEIIKYKTGLEGMCSFVTNLCNIFAMGVINGEQMLNCILYYEDKKVKKQAKKEYQEYLNSLTYTTTIKDENGDIKQIKCSKYVAHNE